MTRSAVVAEDAQHDIREIRRWDRDQGGIALDSRFVAAFERCVAQLEHFPEIGPPIHESQRRAFLWPFPYMLLYEIVESGLVVHRCLHLHRDPRRWRHE